MLLPAEQELVDRDPALPGLAVLLDGDRLADRLGQPVRRTGLRYKPGTSCVLAVSLGGEPALVEAHLPGSPKLEKSVRKAPAGALLAVDAALGLYAARARADRDLPALARLAELLPAELAGGLAGGRLTPLSYNPHRRLVGRLDTPRGPVLVRASRPADASTSVEVVSALHGGAVRTPALLGSWPEHGLAVLEWLPGVALDDALAAGTAGEDAVRAAGCALATLHRREVPALTRPAPSATGADLAAAAALLGVLLPALGDRAAALAERLAGGDEPASAVLHGDLSFDQLVVGPDGEVALLDLDRAGRGDPAVDLGTAEAALRAATPAVDVAHWSAALAAGYAQCAPLPSAERLALHASRALLRRAVEPFRRCRPGWPEAVAALLALAERRALALR